MKDTVSLSKDKRDDDLSEINKFRELVLKNSRMAQFWETKDQLIKSVSISLMKQIMQKPGIGWVRGDKASAEEALSKELTALSKENRELRERVIDLESRISPKLAAIEIDIVSPAIDEHFNSYRTIEMPEALKFDEVERHLLEFVSKQDIDNYNKSIPSQRDLDDYNKECERLYKIKNYSSTLVIDVANSGSAKANNLYVDIQFPEGILVYKTGEKYIEPKNPIPKNPIKRAQAEYSKKLQAKATASSSLYSQSVLGNQFRNPSVLVQPEFALPNFHPINRDWWTRLDGRKITIKIDSLLHTRQMTFDDDYMIVPLIEGKHTIEVFVICEEYDNTERSVVEFNV